MASLSERLASDSVQDFHQSLSLYSELSLPYGIRSVGRELALNLSRAGMETSFVINKILQGTSQDDYNTFHSLAEFYRDTGNFGQMDRMLVASHCEPGFFNDFWLASARKKHEFGQDPQPDLDKVRTHIDTSHKFYLRYRGYSALAEATYDVTNQPQKELLALAREDWQSTIDRNHGIDRSINVIGENEQEYRQELLSHHLLEIAHAYGHCGNYKGAMEFYEMLDPNVVSKDEKRLVDEVLLVKTYLLFNLIQACFKNGDYSEGFALAGEWFDNHKKFRGECFNSDSYTVMAKTALGEALYHEGKIPEGRTMFYQARKGITSNETCGVSDRLYLVNRYQKALLKAGRSPAVGLYDLALQEIDNEPSDPVIEAVKDPYDLCSAEMEGQLNLRFRVDDYAEVAKGYAQIGKFDRAKEALARVEQFGDADNEIKEERIKALSFIAYQEKQHADKLVA